MQTTTQIIDAITVQGMAQALVDQGWLIIEKDTICLPNWDRHNGSSAKARHSMQTGVRRHRTKKKLPSNVNSVTAALPEKRREEEKRKKEKTPNFGEWTQ